MVSPLVRRRRLATELRALREAAGLTHEQLGRQVGMHRLKISRLETATSRPNVPDVMKLLDALGVTGARWHALVQVARDAGDRGWWERYGTDMGGRQQVYADLEAGAVTVREYQTVAVPGLLQLPDYVRARSEQSVRMGEPMPADLARSVEARIARQRMLRRPGGPSYEVVLEELAVRRLGAPPEVMLTQLRHLVELVGDPAGRTAVRILPIEAELPGYLLARTPFSLYTFADPADPQVVAIDTETEDLVLTEPETVLRHQRLYAELRDAALPIEASLVFLMEAADRISSGRRTRNAKPAAGEG
ncbi:helix-turn-helix domain-containing protein [Plantactinospora sp. CA-290183]|uniref:helix-turn-helix domain-containing protein n=1 Tax=Plantactinospora sp. CA-290183 TaxID=3240006 RepID=UPI003D89C90E